MWGRHALRVTGRPSGPPHSAEARRDLRAEFFPRRCFFRAMPLLPGHKLAWKHKKDSQKWARRLNSLTSFHLMKIIPWNFFKKGKGRRAARKTAEVSGCHGEIRRTCTKIRSCPKPRSGEIAEPADQWVRLPDTGGGFSCA